MADRREQMREANQRYAERHPERKRASLARWRQANPDRVAEYNRVNGLKYKRELIDALGGCCACCGETELVFLTLDHIGGVVPPSHYYANGTRKSGKNLLKAIRDEGFPRNKYRVLCWNCNTATKNGRPCPHELAREEAS